VALPVKNNKNPEKLEVKEILEVVMVVTTNGMECAGLQGTTSQKKVIFNINFIHIKMMNSVYRWHCY
jgi:hypothetical protein